jgi:hypothetical protein
LWALEQSIEDRLVLDVSGEVLAAPPPRPDPRPPAPLPEVWRAALAHLVARESAPALGEAIGRVLGAVDLQWGATPGRLLVEGPRSLTLSRALRERGIAWVTAAERESRPERAARFALEVARLVAPALRARAQAMVETLPPTEQERLLAAEAPARPMGAAVGRLVALIAAGNG